MKYLLILFLYPSLFVFSQSKNCDCIVKLSEFGVRWADESKVEGAKKYYDLTSREGKPTTYHKIIKDSVAFWTFIPFYPENKSTTLTLRKISGPVSIRLNFGTADSIPLYSKPDKASKTVRYLKKKELNYKAETKDDLGEHDYAFISCDKDFVKIRMSRDMKNNVGWISKEYYPK